MKPIFGIPPPGSDYIAISHVWGPNLQPYTVAGKPNCPLSSPSKAVVLQQVLNSPENVWLDVASINQQDLGDVAAQVAVMDQIYRNASKIILVLNHEPDFVSMKGTYEALKTIGGDRVITSLKWEVVDAISTNLIPEYASRFWTLQESVLARDVKFLCCCGCGGKLDPLDERAVPDQVMVEYGYADENTPIPTMTAASSSKPSTPSSSTRPKSASTILPPLPAPPSVATFLLPIDAYIPLSDLTSTLLPSLPTEPSQTFNTLREIAPHKLLHAPETLQFPNAPWMQSFYADAEAGKKLQHCYVIYVFEGLKVGFEVWVFNKDVSKDCVVGMSFPFFNAPVVETGAKKGGGKEKKDLGGKAVKGKLPPVKNEYPVSAVTQIPSGITPAGSRVILDATRIKIVSPVFIFHLEVKNLEESEVPKNIRRVKVTGRVGGWAAVQ
ncbi:hypothetical protein HDV05_007922 [Chytridiales sp. JEL 0842]|nr:hypothetical protein HDV05_007922 [Chytridiales sp. JEL 0842]